MAEHSLKAVKVTCKSRKGRGRKLFQNPFLPFPRHLFPKSKVKIRAICQKILCNDYTCPSHFVGGKTHSLSPLVNSRNHFFLFCFCTRTTPKAPGWRTRRSFSCVRDSLYCHRHFQQASQPNPCISNSIPTNTSFPTAGRRDEFYCLEAGLEVSQAFGDKGRGFPSPSHQHTTP